MKKSIKLFALAALGLFVSLALNAQITNSAMSGKITDEAGAVPGAAVVAVHTPSGSQYYAVTNAEGLYSIQGMRPGGPYEVTVQMLGYKTTVYKDINLQLGEVFNQNVTLAQATEQLDEVVVVASVSKFTTEKTGASTNISQSQIAEMPSVNRSISDLARLSPYANGMSFAGGDGRMTNFTLDGANLNNNFGLSSTLPGGGTPVSVDAIQEIQVVVSPYDVRQTNFIGGGVNAITKSGTNTFKGTVYGYYKNQNLRGNKVAGEDLGDRAKESKSVWGVTLGGPIIKNKLFFFVNYEQEKNPGEVIKYRANKGGEAAEGNVSRTLASDMAAVQSYMMSKYGYDTGSYESFPGDGSNRRILARIDWNIANGHKLALRYNYTKNVAWNAPNGNSADTGYRLNGTYRVGNESMAFANNMYSADNKVQTWSLDYSAKFSEKVSNQFLATYSNIEDVRGSNSSAFPHVDIIKQDDSGNWKPYMSLGYELFTWNNAVHNTVANIKDDLTWYAGSHKVTGGVSFEYQMADNQYMRNGTGYYRYSSLNDFLTGAVPQVVCLTYGYDGEQFPAARVRFNKAGIYAQDEWNVTDYFKLTAGLRLDGLFFNNADLMTNNAILALDYYPASHDYQKTNIDTGKWPTANVTVSPRVGFTWDVFGDRSLKVRGGTGLFSGRLPLVFFTNMPTNGGLVQYQAQLGPSVNYDKAVPASVKANYASMDEMLAQFAGGLVTDSQGKATIAALLGKLQSMGYPTTVSPADGVVPSSISAVDPGFKMPQVWKSSLAIDYSFPTAFPLSVTAEGIFNKTINGVSISDWSMNNVGGFARFNGADNRPVYPTSFRNSTKAFVLENTSKGYGWSGNLTVNATPAPGINLMVAYTHTVSKEITGMPGSAAESAFTYVPTSEGPNYIKLHNSQYVTPDRVVASLTHNDNSGNHFSFIYETWRGGYNYSYMTTNDMNGDGYNYDAIYIPTDAQVANNEFRFVSQSDADRFMDFVRNDSYLSKHQGEYAEGYSLYSPWVHRLDFGYKHDFKVKAGNTTNVLQLGFDIKNVLNLFNSSWGVSKYLNPAIGSDARILKYEGVDADGYATFSTPAAIHGGTQTFVPNHGIGQCWYASVGIKYLFN